jgi:hypothetical protein
MKGLRRKFYPSNLSESFVRGLQWLFPLGARLFSQLELAIAVDSEENLANLKDKSLLLLPNHPTFDDAIAMFLLSAKIGVPFHYLADLEQFSNPLLPFMGAYSIRRGAADRQSLTHSISLLSRSPMRLVIFPEGGCSFQNDLVMPFRVGAIHLAFQAIVSQAKAGNSLPDIYVVPVSIKYRYPQNMKKIIERSLEQLEKSLQIKSAQSSTHEPYNRLRKIGEILLQNYEQEYGGIGGDDWNARISHLKKHILDTCESLLEIKSANDEFPRERIYRIQNYLQDRPDWQPKNQEWTAKSVLKALWRLLNFDAIYDGYIAEKPTAERFLDTLIRIERDVFGIDRPTPKAFRKANLYVGKPLRLLDFWADYQRDRTNTVRQLSQSIQATVQSNLDSL